MGRRSNVPELESAANPAHQVEALGHIGVAAAPSSLSFGNRPKIDALTRRPSAALKQAGAEDAPVFVATRDNIKLEMMRSVVRPGPAPCRTAHSSSGFDKPPSAFPTSEIEIRPASRSRSKRSASSSSAVRFKTAFSSTP
jgi:hypothetical protein